MSSNESPEHETIPDEAVHLVCEKFAKLRGALQSVILAQEVAIEQVLLAILCRGHALLQGVPGLAKTLLISSLAQVTGLHFRRIQFTPDLIPADITGIELFGQNEEGTGEVHFHHGPLFANLILAEEINRTSPKTQTALLEAMQERAISIGDRIHPLPNPFFVMATQNPMDQEGAYPLPETQLDRFLFQIKLDYPVNRDAEEAIIRQATSPGQINLSPQIETKDLIFAQNLVLRVLAGDQVIRHAAHLIRASRPDGSSVAKQWVQWGAGPRAGIALVLAAKANALLDGRLHVTEHDLETVSHPALRHRIIPNISAKSAGIDSDQIISDLLLRE